MAKEKNLSELVRKQLLDRIEQLIEEKDFEELRQLLSDSRSSDVAEVVEVLDEIARQILFDLLDPEDAGEVLEKIDEEFADFAPILKLATPSKSLLDSYQEVAAAT